MTNFQIMYLCKLFASNGKTFSSLKGRFDKLSVPLIRSLSLSKALPEPVERSRQKKSVWPL